jgi:hypothetical protein
LYFGSHLQNLGIAKHNNEHAKILTTSHFALEAPSIDISILILKPLGLLLLVEFVAIVLKP